MVVVFFIDLLVYRVDAVSSYEREYGSTPELILIRG